MSRILKWVAAFFLSLMAIYGIFRIVSDRLDYSDGQKAVEKAHPFVQGASSAAGEKLKQTLKETPDAKLEEDSELISRKIYPIIKGALKGQLDAIKNDPNRSELPGTMIETGREITENVIKPFAEGVAQSSDKVLKDVDRGLDELRKFHEKNKDIIESVQSGLKAFGFPPENPNASSGPVVPPETPDFRPSPDGSAKR